MRRSTLLCSGLTLAGLSALPTVVRAGLVADSFDPQPTDWRSFTITTELRLARRGPSRAWVPLPSLTSDWIQPRGNGWQTNATSAHVYRDPASGASMLVLDWTDHDAVPFATVQSRVSTRDRNIDLDGPRGVARLSVADRRRYTAPTRWIPTDGIVKATSDRITTGSTSDLDAARRIYDWIVANTYRNPATRGCGSGDVAALLASGNLGGKCADLNGLYVGLARASGLPARDLYGIRVAPSRFGYKSLGANSGVITGSQHCRAEVFLADYGWVPVDPADVRKVMLEEPPGHLPLTDRKVADADRTLFGAWEGNWIAYNDAADVALPGSGQPPLAFLMYPQAENDGIACDCLDPSAVTYAITAQRPTA